MLVVSREFVTLFGKPSCYQRSKTWTTSFPKISGPNNFAPPTDFFFSHLICSDHWGKPRKAGTSLILGENCVSTRCLETLFSCRVSDWLWRNCSISRRLPGWRTLMRSTANRQQQEKAAKTWDYDLPISLLPQNSMRVRINEQLHREKANAVILFWVYLLHTGIRRKKPPRKQHNYRESDNTVILFCHICPKIVKRVPPEFSRHSETLVWNLPDPSHWLSFSIHHTSHKTPLRRLPPDTNSERPRLPSDQSEKNWQLSRRTWKAWDCPWCVSYRHGQTHAFASSSTQLSVLFRLIHPQRVCCTGWKARGAQVSCTGRAQGLCYTSFRLMSSERKFPSTNLDGGQDFTWPQSGFTLSHYCLSLTPFPLWEADSDPHLETPGEVFSRRWGGCVARDLNSLTIPGALEDAKTPWMVPDSWRWRSCRKLELPPNEMDVWERGFLIHDFV